MFKGVEAISETCAMIQDAQGFDVAKVERINTDPHLSDPDFKPLTDEQWQEWLNIIAAAPVMAEACREMIETGKIEWGKLDKVKHLLRPAIASKAWFDEQLNKAQAKTLWFKACIARMPTAYNPVEEVAIEAHSYDEAVDRLGKLFSRTHSGHGVNLLETLEKEPCKTTDDIGNSRRYPLPKAL